MSDYLAFLRARLDEDEAAARDKRYIWPTNFEVTLNPARVLRKVEADRRILRGFAELDADPARLTDPAKHMIWTVMRDYVVLPIIAVYRDHPDYQESWHE